MEKFFKKYKILLIIINVCFGIALLWLWSIRTQKAERYWDNILINFIVGGFLLFVPLTIGIFIWAKIEEDDFYDDITHLLHLLKRNRMSDKVKKEVARDFVEELARSFGDEILSDPKFDRLAKANSRDKDFVECGICGLPARIVDDKCAKCKLKCFAWKDI